MCANRRPDLPGCTTSVESAPTKPSAIGAVELIHEWHPDCIISTGVAGGIDASLGVMAVVIGAEVIYHDVDCGPGNLPGQVQGLPPSFHGDPRLLECAKSIRADS